VNEEPTQKLPFELQPGESVVLYAHRHVVYLALQLAKVVAAGVVPIIVATWLVAATVGFGGSPGKVILLIELAWLLFWAVKAYFAWYRYENDIWVVTNQRIVDSLKTNWFNHRMASADLVDVEDIAAHRSGILQTAFDFGDLRCQTAGEQPNFVLAGIPHPSRVLGTIDSKRDAARRELSGHRL
jgi:hypothetical protein